MKTAVLMAALALLPIPSSAQQSPRLPTGATALQVIPVAMPNGNAVVILLSNSTAITVYSATGSGEFEIGVAGINATAEQINETKAAVWPPDLEPNLHAVSGNPPLLAPRPPDQGISGAPHPVEVTFSYNTPSGTGTATITVVVRLPNPKDTAETVLQRQVQALQRIFPPH